MRRVGLIFGGVALAAVALVSFASLRHAAPVAPTARLARSTSLDLVLTPLAGDGKEDREIATLQHQIAERGASPQLLERLGWTFVSKARLTSDPGFYKLAEQCSAAMEQTSPGNADAALLRGHIFHALHRFKDAEAVARQLVSEREFVFDYALLGDALMEQGQLVPAVEAYQKMVDLKPCLQTYSRVAHIRWLKGDLAGAVSAARFAVRAGSPREPEALAWACTRLAAYLLQQNDIAAADAAAEQATQAVADYAPALLMRGKVLLAQSRFADAVVPLAKAAEKCPLPEYLWTYSEALRASGDAGQARTIEERLHATGAANDPRTYALFLATTENAAPEALRLARAELEARQDVFTHDALAWALYRSGDIAAARAERDLALAEGTHDARLYLHAGIIAAAAREPERAIECLNQAQASAGALLPSERTALVRAIAASSSPANRISSK